MSNNATTKHKTVLIQEVLDALKPGKNKVYVDATFGGGGHTRAILNAEPTCKVIGLDWDNESIERHAPALEEEFGDRLTVLWGNFAHIYRLLKKNKRRSIAFLDFSLRNIYRKRIKKFINFKKLCGVN